MHREAYELLYIKERKSFHGVNNRLIFQRVRDDIRWGFSFDDLLTTMRNRSRIPAFAILAEALTTERSVEEILDDEGVLDDSTQQDRELSEPPDGFLKKVRQSRKNSDLQGGDE